MNEHEELLERWRETTQAIDQWSEAHKRKVGRPNVPKRRVCTHRLHSVAKRLAETLTDMVEERERLQRKD